MPRLGRHCSLNAYVDNIPPTNPFKVSSKKNKGFYFLIASLGQDCIFHEAL